MADSELDFSTTAASNTAIGALSTQGSAQANTIDDLYRAFMAARAAAITRQVVKAAGSYTAVKADHNQFWRCTGAVSIALTAAATLKDGWALWVQAYAGVVTIDPNGAETINLASTLVLEVGQTALIINTGSAFFTMVWTVQPSMPGQSKGYLHGLTLSNNASDATNDIDIAAGSARTAADDYTIVNASSITKRLDAAWAVGTGNGGRDTGSIADGTWHIHLIRRSDTGVVDALFSTSATAPTMPTNYDQRRRIGSVVRTGSTLVAFQQDGDRFRWSAPQIDINVTNPGTSAVTRTLTVPTGITIWADIVALGNNATSGQYFMLVTALDETDSVPSVAICTAVIGTTAGGGMPNSAPLLVKTNGSAQVRSRQSVSGASDVFRITTYGWIDTRGKMA